MQVDGPATRQHALADGEALLPSLEACITGFWDVAWAGGLPRKKEPFPGLHWDQGHISPLSHSLHIQWQRTGIASEAGSASASAHPAGKFHLLAGPQQTTLLLFRHLRPLLMAQPHQHSPHSIPAHARSRAGSKHLHASSLWCLEWGWQGCQAAATWTFSRQLHRADSSALSSFDPPSWPWYLQLDKERPKITCHEATCNGTSPHLSTQRTAGAHWRVQARLQAEDSRAWGKVGSTWADGMAWCRE